MQKKICAEYGKVLQVRQHARRGLGSFLVLLTFLPIVLCCVAVLCIGRYSAAPLASNSQQWELDNILKVSKSIELLVKMKNVSLILRNTLNGFFGQPNRMTEIKTTKVKKDER